MTCLALHPASANAKYTPNLRCTESESAKPMPEPSTLTKKQTPYRWTNASARRQPVIHGTTIANDQIAFKRFTSKREQL